MFAVMKTGGKQYKVQAGDILRVEKLAADAGETVQFNEILMIGGDSVTVGAPLVAGAGVQAEVVDQIKGEKVIHFVKRRRKHSSQRTKGHRQKLTLVKITEILAEGADKSGVKAAAGAGSVPKASSRSAAPAAAGDDLTKITGVGPAAAKKLNEAGINTYADLAAVNPDTFEATKVKAEWVEQAKELA
ncbi:50S ribosomal protein L21 [Sagittula sp. NFXS13]|uniref:Large ribosomal subunit protein bL21 n=1 Tax=Sagittula marina TaxID=943940 RepID=A0A7W6GTW7_9RHOB|nr:50S ribosomal protein L21 [Sagittula marina]MBB3987560.1 large subunit ribosomal protein L21 [Sagittula marina]